MKKISKALCILTCTLLGHFAFAQVDLTRLDEQKKRIYPDTLILRTESQLQVNFAFYRMSDKKEYLTNDLWQGILSTMTSSVQSSSYSEGVEVSYRKIKQGEEEVAKIEVSPIEPSTDIFVIGKEGLVEMPATRIEFKIYEPNLAVSFFLTDLSQLEEIIEVNVESVWDQIDSKYKNYGKRDIYRGNGLIKFGNANIDAITSKSLGTDAIELSAGVGLGFYRDRFVPDLGFKVGFHMPDRLGREKLEFGLLYTQHYFFNQEQDGAYNLDLNGFLSGFVAHQFLEDYELGLAFGVLIHRDGGFFEGNTYKMSLYTSGDDEGFNFTPELIFVNGFKNAFPALRVGLTF